MKKVKRALLFCLFGLLVVIIISLVLDSNLQGAQGSKLINEDEPNTYDVGSYVDLFILDGASSRKYLFIDVIINGKFVHIDEDTHTIILQDLDNESRYLRAVVPKEKWAKVRNIKENHSIYIIGYATHLSYFNEPVVMVRDIGKS